MKTRQTQALRCLIDTNLVIGLLKAQAASVNLLKASNCQLSALAVSQITRLELLGIVGTNASEIRAIESFLSNVQVLLISSKAEAQTIVLRKSKKIKLPDAIVAATVLAHGLELLTLDASLKIIFQMKAAI